LQGRISVEITHAGAMSVGPAWQELGGWERLGMAMNQSLLTADGATHWKMAALSLVWALLVVTIGLAVSRQHAAHQAHVSVIAMPSE